MYLRGQNLYLVAVPIEMKLFFRELGHGQPLIILHGLFGSSDNWYSLSKVFADYFRVYVVDQRNHGQSPQVDQHDYNLLTEDLHDFITAHQIEQPIIIGHSMGGKVAMNFAIKYPNKLSKLIVVDIMPKSYPVHHDAILQGLNAIRLDKLESRGQADKILSEFVDNAAVRQFLLKNLARDDQQKFEWRINIPVLEKNIEEMGVALKARGKFESKTLFIVGSKSNYFERGDELELEKLFPLYKMATIDAGHWVQAEKPKEFTETVLKFLEVAGSSQT